MQFLLFSLLLSVMATLCLCQTFLQASGADLVYGGKKVLLKGTNFDNVPALGAAIGSGNPNTATYSEFDFSEVARSGSNHVRYGMSFSWWSNYRADFWIRLDRDIALARKYNIWMVLNLFTTPANCYEGYSSTCSLWNNAWEQAQLKDFWVDVATRYRNEPAVAGYDLLNEPTPASGCRTWFALATELRNAVAAVAPNQLVFIEGCSDMGNDLKYNDPPRGANIVWEVHEYYPIDMTHDMFSPGSHYPGMVNEWYGSCYINKTVLETGIGCQWANLRETYSFNYARQQNVPIYVGEWGASSVLSGYLQFTQDRAELYRDWGLNHAFYTWKHDTVKLGGFYQWGVYSWSSTLDDPAKLDAFKIALAGAVIPNFNGNSATSSPASPPPTPLTSAPTTATATLPTPSATPPAVSTLPPTVSQWGSSPFSGAPILVPAQSILFVNYDNGGEGVAYHDEDPFAGNSKGFRTNERVDMEPSPTGGFNVAYTRLGEWLAYTVDVNLDGLYRVDINLGQTAPGGTYHLEMDSVPLFAPQQVPAAPSGWQATITQRLPDVQLARGVHLLKLVIDSEVNWSAGNFKHVTFTRLDAAPPQPPPPTQTTSSSTSPAPTSAAPTTLAPTTTLQPSAAWARSTSFFSTPAWLPGALQVEDFDRGGAEVAYSNAESSALNSFYRLGDYVPLRACSACSMTNGGVSTQLLVAGKWLQYTVYVQGGVYALSVRASNAVSGASCHLEFDGTQVTQSLQLQQSGSNFVDNKLPGLIQIDRGYHTLRLVVDAAGGQYDFILFQSQTSSLAAPITFVVKSVPTTKKRQATAAADLIALAEGLGSVTSQISSRFELVQTSDDSITVSIAQYSIGAQSGPLSVSAPGVSSTAMSSTSQMATLGFPVTISALAPAVAAPAALALSAGAIAAIVASVAVVAVGTLGAFIAARKLSSPPPNAPQQNEQPLQELDINPIYDRPQMQVSAPSVQPAHPAAVSAFAPVAFAAPPAPAAADAAWNPVKGIRKTFYRWFPEER